MTERPSDYGHADKEREPLGPEYDQESDAIASLAEDLLMIAIRVDKPPMPICQPDVRAINRAIDTIIELRKERDAARRTTRSAVVASVTEEGFTQQIHFMQRQSQMLSEQGDDVASRVMAEAGQMVADVWKDRERYRKGMENWKATAEAKDRGYARSASERTCGCGAKAGQYHATGCGHQGVFNG